MANKDLIIASEMSPILQEIKTVLDTARSNVARQVNSELLNTYWNIGRIICEYEQSVPDRADYGKQTLKALSSELTKEFGKGFSRSNLQNMRQFYLSYEKCQTLSGKLSWSHYCELLSISDIDKRSFYEKEAVNSGWSVRELKRQIESSLFERLLLSRGDANKEQVLALALDGNEIAQPSDIIRDPYVFEFLGLPEDKPVMESDLERALVQQIEKFLLELGRGFMFVGTQQRVTLNNTHFYVDMVFYNKILRAYVLIELKTTKLTPEAAGQINMYLNYYAAEINDPDDNPPIGIILCTDKDSITAEYALGGLSNNIFASRYVLYMPNKEQLIRQVEAVLEKWHKDTTDDIVPERDPMNVHFKTPTAGYTEMFEQMVSDRMISTRGLKPDADKFGELVFDVNSAYFYNHGGYDFAKRFYEDAYKAAVKIVGGEQFILSAVMHADERNRAMSDALGQDVYHYHLHVVYVPVVEKEIKWTKRCKDPSWSERLRSASCK